MISRDTVQQILDTTRIDEVISDFVNLKRKGANLVGLCPFHNEKTPSFYVSPSKDIYKCFGCGKAGNSVRFLMEHEKFTYPEALRFLAKKYRIDIQETESNIDEAEKDEISSIYIVLAFAEDYYNDLLINSEEGKNIGLAYLDHREVSKESIDKFKIGYSPGTIDHFTRAALDKQYNEEYLIASGMTIKTHDGRLIDRFRDRIMFPIRTVAGRTIGFGGRTLKSDPKEAKYINSPETKVYNKSNFLYGLDSAKDQIRKSDVVYLVEGYTDVISMFQAGVENVIASLGTSMTERHAALIKRYTPNLTFIFDGDEAGIKASLRGIDIALKQGLAVKAIALPEGEDPDTFSKQKTPKQLKLYLKENVEDFIFFKAKLHLRTDADNPIKKAEAIRNIVVSIAAIPSQVTRSLYVKELGRLLDVDENILFSELNKHILNKRSSQLRMQKRRTGQPSQGTVSLEKESQATVINQEQKIIKLLVLYGSLLYDEERTVARVITDEIAESEWEDALMHQIFNEYVKVFNDTKEYPGIRYFINHSDQQIQEFISRVALDKDELSVNWKTQFGKETEIDKNYRNDVNSALAHLDLRKCQSKLERIRRDLKKSGLDEKEVLILQKTQLEFIQIIQGISKNLKVVIY